MSVQGWIDLAGSLPYIMLAVGAYLCWRILKS